MGRYINPFTDWGFKMIFGQEANKDILIFFLNELLKGERVITDLSFLDKESLGNRSDERSLIYDIYCKTDTGEYIIVEMQNRSQSNFIDRSIYYVAKSLVSQPMKGDWGYQLVAVYGVFFMNFTMPNFLGRNLRTDVIMANRETGEMLSDKMRMIYLQLPCFNKGESDCDNDFERFIYVLKKMEILDRMPFEKKNFIFTRLAKIAEVRKLTKQEQIDYDASLKKYRDAYNVMRTQREEGREEGRQEGRKEGMKEGMKKGMKEGRKEGERNKAFEIAHLMKESGMTVEDICRLTGLTPEEVEKC